MVDSPFSLQHFQSNFSQILDVRQELRPDPRSPRYKKDAAYRALCDRLERQAMANIQLMRQRDEEFFETWGGKAQ